MPEKPMKAMASIPAVMSAIGTPCMAFGIFVSVSCSRMLEKMIRAIA